jgi:hypothetical protein
MNYYSQYRQYITGGNRVSKGDIQPYGIYKISTYKYVDEGRKTLSGDYETLIFVTGIFQKKVSALKLSNIQPLKFLNWFKRVANNVVEQTPTSNTGLYMLEAPMDNGGNRIYDSYIRNNKDFVAKGAAYRTYNLDGIQYATEVFLKNDIIKRYYG